MRPKPYPRGIQLSPRVRELVDQGALRRLPYQEAKDDLFSSDGVDIVYDLRNMNPTRFMNFVDALLLAAAYEADRYSELEFRYAKWIVELNVSGRSRRDEKPRRQYVAAQSRDTDTMVFGDVTAIPVEFGGSGKSLADKAEAIINMLDTGSPGAYVTTQNPYKVIQLVISVRHPFSTTRRELREAQEADDLGLVRVRRSRE